MRIYHGSDKIIEKPTYGLGAGTNDYGRGFYCTEFAELAKEWACKKGTDGYANAYEFELTDLQVLNLNSQEYHILHWLALLTRYRGYWQKQSIAEEAKQFLQEHYLLNLEDVDVIIGYRADDSYFSFAKDFISGTISLQKLSEAMHLGQLGEQIVVRSEKAFLRLNFTGYEVARAQEYFVKKEARDLRARRAYAATRRSVKASQEIYIMDILRGKVSEDELRI